jgi:chorismate dehydratase
VTKYKISAVSYTNTIPFIYGLKQSGLINSIDLALDNPSDCAAKLINNQVDIGLVPVAALSAIPGCEIISDYCIGASGAVNSVFIFSNKLISEIKTLQFDVQSRTSNYLAKVLLKNYWKTNPEIVNGRADAFVEIGDRTFGKKDQYAFAYDLAEEWNSFTGLPFVFAVWAANKSIDAGFIEEFNAALKLGLDSRVEVVKTLPREPGFNIEDYLLYRVDYSFNAAKKQALLLFLGYLKELD